MCFATLPKSVKVHDVNLPDYTSAAAVYCNAELILSVILCSFEYSVCHLIYLAIFLPRPSHPWLRFHSLAPDQLHTCQVIFLSIQNVDRFSLLQGNPVMSIAYSAFFDVVYAANLLACAIYFVFN